TASRSSGQAAQRSSREGGRPSRRSSCQRRTRLLTRGSVCMDEVLQGVGKGSGLSWSWQGSGAVKDGAGKALQLSATAFRALSPLVGTDERPLAVVLTPGPRSTRDTAGTLRG